jgi:hypothetical protein
MQYVVEYRKIDNFFTYRKLSLIEADSREQAARMVADRLAADKRLDYRLHSSTLLRPLADG